MGRRSRRVRGSWLRRSIIVERRRRNRDRRDRRRATGCKTLRRMLDTFERRQRAPAGSRGRFGRRCGGYRARDVLFRPDCGASPLRRDRTVSDRLRRVASYPGPAAQAVVGRRSSIWLADCRTVRALTRDPGASRNQHSRGEGFKIALDVQTDADAGSRPARVQPKEAKPRR